MADETSTPEQIAEATKQGWVDDESHPKYKPAAEFLEVGKTIAPVQAEKIKGLEDKLDRANQLAEKNGQQVKDMQDHLFADLNAREKAGYNKALKEIEDKKLAAVEEGDTEEYQRLKREGDNLEPPKKKEPKKEEKQEVQQIDPEFVEWRKDGNDWYGDVNNPNLTPMNRAMSTYADSIRDECMVGCTTNTQVLDKISAKVKEQFPTQFGEQEIDDEETVNAATVDTGGRKPPRRNNGKKDWRSLPKEARETATANGYVNRYFAGDKEKFAAKYYEQFQE